MISTHELSGAARLELCIQSRCGSMLEHGSSRMILPPMRRRPDHDARSDEAGVLESCRGSFISATSDGQMLKSWFDSPPPAHLASRSCHYPRRPRPGSNQNQDGGSPLDVPGGVLAPDHGRPPAGGVDGQHAHASGEVAEPRLKGKVQRDRAGENGTTVRVVDVVSGSND